MKIRRATLGLSIVTAILLLVPAGANGYNRYGDGCDSCHPGYDGPGDTLHDLHVGADAMTTTCNRCHGSTGDNPRLEKCAGCHIAVGLRTHHRTAGTSTCGNTSCHPSDPAAAPENTIPPYYGMADINIDHPCFADPDGDPRGEDFDGDLRGLDNDGDLAYDAGDSDCGAVAVDEMAGGIARPPLTSRPNPFVRETTVLLHTFAAETSGEINVEVFDASGALVVRLFSGDTTGLPGQLTWDGRDTDNRSVGAGTYFVRASSATVVAIAKLVRVE